MAEVVLAHVLHVEALRQREVHLHGGELPEAADGVVEVEVDLGPVERALPLRHLEGQPAALEGRPKRLRGPLPHR